MRGVLNSLYRLSGILASAFIVLICTTVLIQVAFNLVDKVAQLVTGSAIGFVLPSYAEFAGYFLAASMSFALADTLKSNSHIRVTLITLKMSDFQFWLSELFACLTGTFISLFFAFWSFNLVYESFKFGDLSPGIVAVPLWIPQLSMAIGVATLAICFIDLLITTATSATTTRPSKEVKG